MWKQWNRPLALAGGFLLLAAPIQAQPGPGGQGLASLGQRIALALWNRAELELTDRQVQDLRALRADFEDRMVELRQEVREERNQAREQLREDRETLRDDRDAMRQQVLEMRQQMRATRERVREAGAPFVERYGEILNADQREWLAARAARAGRQVEPRAWRGPGAGPVRDGLRSRLRPRLRGGAARPRLRAP